MTQTSHLGPTSHGGGQPQESLRHSKALPLSTRLFVARALPWKVAPLGSIRWGVMGNRLGVPDDGSCHVFVSRIPLWKFSKSPWPNPPPEVVGGSPFHRNRHGPTPPLGGGGKPHIPHLPLPSPQHTFTFAPLLHLPTHSL